MDFLNIQSLLSSAYFAIPDYQRDYEWGNTEVQTLADDVFEVMQDPSIKQHFLGAIVTVPFEEEYATCSSINFKKYGIDTIKHVVDGQQRLTTFTLFLQALADTLSEEDDDEIKAIRDDILYDIKSTLRGSNHEPGSLKKAPKLILNGNTGACYNTDVMCVRNDECNRGFRGAKRMLSAFRLLKQCIIENKIQYLTQRSRGGACEYYECLTSVLRTKMKFVEISCTDSADAFQVFDSLNGKGLDLTATDRVKNIFMSWCKGQGDAVQKWSALTAATGEEYFSNFLVALFFCSNQSPKRISKNKLPDKFKATYLSSAKKDFNCFFKSILEDAKLYGTIRKASTRNPEIDGLLSDFNTLKFEQPFTLIFAVAKRFESYDFKSKWFVAFIKELLSLNIRMQICEKSMNKMDRVFADILKTIAPDGVVPDIVTTELEKRKLNITPDIEFKTSFAQYCPADSKTQTYYLRKLEYYLCQQVKDKKDRKLLELSKDGLSVEHIIPQTLTLPDIKSWYENIGIPEDILENFQDSVIQNIGNLALLYTDDNSSASNSSYKDKIKVYKSGKKNQDKGTPEHTFMLIKLLMEEYPNRFTHKEVEQRAKKLAEYALKIW